MENVFEKVNSFFVDDDKKRCCCNKNIQKGDKLIVKHCTNTPQNKVCHEQHFTQYVIFWWMEWTITSPISQYMLLFHIVISCVCIVSVCEHLLKLHEERNVIFFSKSLNLLTATWNISLFPTKQKHYMAKLCNFKWILTLWFVAINIALNIKQISVLTNVNFSILCGEFQTKPHWKTHAHVCV